MTPPEPTPEDRARAREIAVKVYALMPEDAGNAASGLIYAAIREAEDRGRRKEREACARLMSTLADRPDDRFGGRSPRHAAEEDPTTYARGVVHGLGFAAEAIRALATDAEEGR